MTARSFIVISLISLAACADAPADFENTAMLGPQASDAAAGDSDGRSTLSAEEISEVAAQTSRATEIAVELTDTTAASNCLSNCPNDVEARNEDASDSLALDAADSSEGNTDGNNSSTAEQEAPLSGCDRALTEANKNIVATAIDELFVQGDIGAVDRFWGEPYLQHNPIATSGVDTFRNLFSGLITPGSSIYELSRVVADCELVLIHGDYTSFGGATFDLFRLDNGRIVEHWDAAAVGAGPNASGNTALDGAVNVQNVESSGANMAVVLDFVQRVLIDGEYDQLALFVSADLIEHNAGSSNGSASYRQFLQGNAVTYRQVHYYLGDGNFVFVLSEGSVAGTDVAFYDLFRVEGSQIVEHWDGRRDVPETTASGLGIF